MNEEQALQAVDAAEARLGEAMLASDDAALERLLAPELVFVNHLGMRLGREQDLAAHRSGMLRIRRLQASDRQVRLLPGGAAVSVCVQVEGTYDGQPANGRFRFLRIWQAPAGDGEWQVVAAQSTLVA